MASLYARYNLLAEDSPPDKCGENMDEEEFLKKPGISALPNVLSPVVRVYRKLALSKSLWLLEHRVRWSQPSAHGQVAIVPWRP